jgi:uncharacterized membrane protein YkoI
MFFGLRRVSCFLEVGPRALHIDFDKETSMINRRALFIIVLALYAASLLVAQSAMAWPCSVRPKKGTSRADLRKMAKVSKEEAQATALANLKIATATSVSEAELELERGCLVYSFDVHAAGQKGITEIVVDAGTGKLLSRMDESEAQEAAEKSAEKNESGNNH